MARTSVLVAPSGGAEVRRATASRGESGSNENVREGGTTLESARTGVAENVRGGVAACGLPSRGVCAPGAHCATCIAARPPPSLRHGSSSRVPVSTPSCTHGCRLCRSGLQAACWRAAGEGGGARSSEGLLDGGLVRRTLPNRSNRGERGRRLPPWHHHDARLTAPSCAGRVRAYTVHAGTRCGRGRRDTRPIYLQVTKMSNYTTVFF